MASCLNTKSVEYQTLKKMSGLSDFKFKAYVSSFFEENNRFPELDELPEANSEAYVRGSLLVREVGDSSYVDNLRILDETGTNSLEEAVVILNNKYRDLEINIFDMGDVSSIKITHRPDDFSHPYNGGIEISLDVSKSRNAGVVKGMLDRLASLYGIRFKSVTDSDLNAPEWQDKVLDARLTNAFIYNGDIYVNIDHSSIDAPIHEMLHIVLGATRFQDPELYSELVNSVASLPNIGAYKELYKDRTNNDLLEEVLVSQYAKHLAGLDNVLSQLEAPVFNKLQYNIKRTLDSMLNGQLSIKTLSDYEIFNNSLLMLGGKVGSKELDSFYRGSFDLAQTSRKLANYKSDLLKSGKLIELCE